MAVVHPYGQNSEITIYLEEFVQGKPQSRYLKPSGMQPLHFSFSAPKTSRIEHRHPYLIFSIVPCTYITTLTPHPYDFFFGKDLKLCRENAASIWTIWLYAAKRIR